LKDMHTAVGMRNGSEALVVSIGKREYKIFAMRKWPDSFGRADTE
jgi:hypothetical protein